MDSSDNKPNMKAPLGGELPPMSRVQEMGGSSDDFAAHENPSDSKVPAQQGSFDDTTDVLPEEELLYDLADLFKVFSDTTRIKILYALMDVERSVNEIAEATGTSQSAVSHQLRILKQAHLVKFRRDGRNIHYSLADDHVLTILDQGLTHICE